MSARRGASIQLQAYNRAAAVVELTELLPSKQQEMKAKCTKVSQNSTPNLEKSERDVMCVTRLAGLDFPRRGIADGSAKKFDVSYPSDHRVFERKSFCQRLLRRLNLETLLPSVSLDREKVCSVHQICL